MILPRHQKKLLPILALKSNCSLFDNGNSQIAQFVFQPRSSLSSLDSPPWSSFLNISLSFSSTGTSLSSCFEKDTPPMFTQHKHHFFLFFLLTSTFFFGVLLLPLSTTFVPPPGNFSILASNRGEGDQIQPQVRNRFGSLAIFLFHTPDSLELATLQYSALVDSLQEGKVHSSNVSIEVCIQTTPQTNDRALLMFLNQHATILKRNRTLPTRITIFPSPKTKQASERNAILVDEAFQRYGMDYLLNNTAVLLLDGDMIPISPLTFSNLNLGEYPITCSSRQTFPNKKPVYYYCWVGWILLFPELDESFLKKFTVVRRSGADTGSGTRDVTDVVGLNWMRKTRIPPGVNFANGVFDGDIQWIAERVKEKCYFGQIFSIGDSHFFHMWSAASKWRFPGVKKRYKIFKESLKKIKNSPSVVIEDMKEVISLNPELSSHPYGPCDDRQCCKEKQKPFFLHNDTHKQEDLISNI